MRKVVAVIAILTAIALVSTGIAIEPTSKPRIALEPWLDNNIARLGTEEILKLAEKNETIRKIIEEDRKIKPVEIESLKDVPRNLPVYVYFNTSVKTAQTTQYNEVWVWIVADEEFRSYFGSNWKTVAYNIVESADNAFYRDHGINFIVGKYSEWYSSDGVNDISQLLNEAQEETGWNNNHQGMDMLTILTNQPTNMRGASEIGGNSWIIKHQYDDSKDWHLAQHEASHNYYVGDHGYFGPYCIMTGLFVTSTDQWCDSCDQVIEDNRGHFG